MHFPRPDDTSATPHRRTRPVLRLPPLLLAVLLLAGCDLGFLGETDSTAPLEGERIAILSLGESLGVDPTVASLPVTLPAAVRNPDWPQPGGNAANVMGHLVGPTVPEAVWEVDIGAGSSSETQILASPVVADGRIFTLDRDGLLSAFSAATGQRLWERETATPDEEEVAFAGGITTGGGLVFVANGAGAIRAMSPENGELVWTANAPGPVRSAPTWSDEQIYVITIDNQAAAFSARTGERFWVHSGISEVTALLGNANPAVRDAIVTVPYSSGEIYALAAGTGRVFWIDSLRRVRRSTSVASLADIRGDPVIDDDRVIAVSHSGRTSALDFRTGTRIWDSPVGSTQTPWVAGNFVFLVSNQAEVICLTRDQGRVRWITQLPRYLDEEDREDPITHVGPILVSGSVLVASSEGTLAVLSAETGVITDMIDLDDAVHVPPVVADGTLYVLTDNGRLTAYR